MKPIIALFLFLICLNCAKARSLAQHDHINDNVPLNVGITYDDIVNQFGFPQIREPSTGYLYCLWKESSGGILKVLFHRDQLGKRYLAERIFTDSKDFDVEKSAFIGSRKKHIYESFSDPTSLILNKKYTFLDWNGRGFGFAFNRHGICVGTFLHIPGTGMVNAFPL